LRDALPQNKQVADVTLDVLVVSIVSVENIQNTPADQNRQDCNRTRQHLSRVFDPRTMGAPSLERPNVVRSTVCDEREHRALFTLDAIGDDSLVKIARGCVPSDDRAGVNGEQRGALKPRERVTENNTRNSAPRLRFRQNGQGFVEAQWFERVWV